MAKEQTRKMPKQQTDSARQAEQQDVTRHGFQAEARQLLKLMIHSLYSHKEVFLRELISNASDATDRLRFEALQNPDLLADDSQLQVRVEVDAQARELRVHDNGIGMSEQELIDNLGTIARSGTARFMEQLSGDAARDSQLIGQFGVGFYASFIVADQVTVETRRADAAAQSGWRWQSGGEADYAICPIQRAQRGTTVILHLRPDADEFLNDLRLRHLVKKYADHISIPVQLKASKAPDGEAETEAEQSDWETVNEASALWSRPRNKIKKDEYLSFYQHIAHDFQEPLIWGHNRVEGRLEYISLLFVPGQAPFDLWNRESPRGLKLYVRRVFIMDDAEQFLPLYLRFVRGVVDCPDLPLNVSRELLQQDTRVSKMRTAITRRVLDLLHKLADKEPDKYQQFWDQMGQALKEGVTDEADHQQRVVKLLRFASTHGDGASQNQSLADYHSRIKEGQKEIWYAVGDSHAGVAAAPHLEVFRKHNIEVLLLSDPLDEWMMGHLGKYEDLPLKDVARGDLDLTALGIDDAGQGQDAQDQAAQKDADDTHTLLQRIKERLGDRVQDVRSSNRLTDSPACLTLAEGDMGPQMRRLLQGAGQPLASTKPVLEINTGHPLVQRLQDEEDAQRADDLAHILLDHARLADAESLDDPASYVQRINRLLVQTN